MWKLVLVFLIALLYEVPAFAQSVVIDLGLGTPETIPANAQNVAAIQRIAAAENETRAAQIPPLPPITADRYIRNFLVEKLQNAINDAKSHEVANACKSYAAASQLVRTQINTALGGNSPCR